MKIIKKMIFVIRFYIIYKQENIYQMKNIILPAQNEVDLDDVPDEILNSIQFFFVNSIDEVFQHAFNSGKYIDVKTTS